MLDIINFIYFISIIFLVFKICNIPMNYYFFIVIHYIVVFLLNDVLFPVSYMPDQWRYLFASSQIRENLDFFSYWNYDRSEFGSVSHASLLFSIFPILFIDSVYSLSLVNTTIFSLIFIFLYRRKYLDGYGSAFYLLFPSLMLYSGVGLRDTWIFLFMILSIYFFINNRFIFSIVFSIPLIFIKYQNFIIFLVAIASYKIITLGKQSFFYLIIKVLLMVGLVQILISIIGIEFLDFYRLAFYAEEGGKVEDYIPLSGATDVLINSTIGAFGVLLRPFPWEASGFFQLIQSVENLVVFYFIYLLVKKQIQIKDKKVWFLLVYLFVGMSLYGLIIYNFGTAVRYRFPFVTIFIVFSYYLLYIKKENIDK